MKKYRYLPLNPGIDPGDLPRVRCAICRIAVRGLERHMRRAHLR